MDNQVKAVGVGIVGILLLVFFALTYFTVEQYERSVVTSFGKMSYVADPGLHFKMPFVNSVYPFRTDIQSVVIADRRADGSQTGVNTYTVDNQEVDVVSTIFYRLPVDKIEFIYQNAQDYKPRLASIAVDRLKAEFGKVNAAHVAEKRGELRDAIKAVLKREAQALGVDVTDFQLTNLEYTKSFRSAVEQAASAKAMVETREQEKQQAIRQAERAKIDAEGKANAAREAAKGEADAKLVVAQAEAKGIQLRGEAQALAMAKQAEALAKNPTLVEMKKAENWNGALPTQMLSGITPFMQFTAPVPRGTVAKVE